MRPFAQSAMAVVAAAASTSCWSQPSQLTFSPSDLDSPAEVAALNRSVAAALSRCEDVSLRFRGGIYRGVRLFIDDRGRTSGCDADLTIDRAGDGSVVFEGAQEPKFVDIVTHYPSFRGAIRNVEIRDYINGIAVVRTNSRKRERVRWAADTAGEKAGNPGLTISGVVFKNVGDWDRNRDAVETGWGAIVFNFAHNNRVVGNRFEGLGNTVDSPLMHALYLVGSSGNVISNNYFGAMDGAAIKLRNRSDANRITDNLFRFGGEPIVQLWFCNQSKRGEANCPIDECPSTGTVFANNRIVHTAAPDRTRRGGGPVPVTTPFVSYERMDGLRVVERFYVASGVPKTCPGGAAAPLIQRGDGNSVQRAG